MTKLDRLASLFRQLDLQTLLPSRSGDVASRLQKLKLFSTLTRASSQLNSSKAQAVTKLWSSRHVVDNRLVALCTERLRSLPLLLHPLVQTARRIPQVLRGCTAIVVEVKVTTEMSAHRHRRRRRRKGRRHTLLQCMRMTLKRVTSLFRFVFCYISIILSSFLLSIALNYIYESITLRSRGCVVV